MADNAVSHDGPDGAAAGELPSRCLAAASPTLRGWVASTARQEIEQHRSRLAFHAAEIARWEAVLRQAIAAEDVEEANNSSLAEAQSIDRDQPLPLHSNRGGSSRFLTSAAELDPSMLRMQLRGVDEANAAFPQRSKYNYSPVEMDSAALTGGEEAVAADSQASDTSAHLQSAMHLAFLRRGSADKLYSSSPASRSGTRPDNEIHTDQQQQQSQLSVTVHPPQGSLSASPSRARSASASSRSSGSKDVNYPLPGVDGGEHGLLLTHMTLSRPSIQRSRELAPPGSSAAAGSPHSAPSHVSQPRRSFSPWRWLGFGKKKADVSAPFNVRRMSTSPEHSPVGPTGSSSNLLAEQGSSPAASPLQQPLLQLSFAAVPARRMSLGELARMGNSNSHAQQAGADLSEVNAGQQQPQWQQPQQPKPSPSRIRMAYASASAPSSRPGSPLPSSSGPGPGMEAWMLPPSSSQATSAAALPPFPPAAMREFSGEEHKYRSLPPPPPLPPSLLLQQQAAAAAASAAPAGGEDTDASQGPVEVKPKRVSWPPGPPPIPSAMLHRARSASASPPASPQLQGSLDTSALPAAIAVPSAAPTSSPTPPPLPPPYNRSASSTRLSQSLPSSPAPSDTGAASQRRLAFQLAQVMAATGSAPAGSGNAAPSSSSSSMLPSSAASSSTSGAATGGGGVGAGLPLSKSPVPPVPPIPPPKPLGAALALHGLGLAARPPLHHPKEKDGKDASTAPGGGGLWDKGAAPVAEDGSSAKSRLRPPPPTQRENI